MKTLSKILLGVVMIFFVGSVAFAQEAQQQDTATYDTETQDTYDTESQTADEYETETETETETQETYDTETETETQDQGMQEQGMNVQEFSTYDANADGQIDQEEFAVAYSDSGMTETEEGVTESDEPQTEEGGEQEMVAAVFESADEDASGYLDEEEFTTWTSGSETKKK